MPVKREGDGGEDQILISTCLNIFGLHLDWIPRNIPVFEDESYQTL
jgi:hypothetical protein